jgi:hypothetical protein
VFAHCLGAPHVMAWARCAGALADIDFRMDVADLPGSPIVWEWFYMELLLSCYLINKTIGNI